MKWCSILPGVETLILNDIQKHTDIKRYTKSIIEEWMSTQGQILNWRMNVVFERPLGNV